MQAPLKINPETAELLAARARARGLSVEEYLKSLLVTTTERERLPESTVDEFIAAMESMAEDVEPLPRDFSREDIYFPEG